MDLEVDMTLFNFKECKIKYKIRLGTEYPSFVRLESVRKGSCEECGKDVIKRLKDDGY